jgi:hypothetical protein
MTGILEVIQGVAGVATAVAVVFAALDLRATKEQARTTFADQVSSQYREISRRLPIEALLGETLSDSRQNEALPNFYHYFDLSNEQAYLHEKRRISEETWHEWKAGIQQNFRRPAFATAWWEVSSRAPESFDELRRLVGEMGRSEA